MEIFLIILWMLCALFAFLVAREGSKGLAALLGFLLGPIGVVIAFFMRD